MGNIAGSERKPIGSSESPFGMAPSSERFYSSLHYREACDAIVDGIGARRGLILVTGEPGTGKTTIVQQAIDRLDKGSCSTLFCTFHPALDETLNSLCQHLGLSVAEQGQQQKAQQLNQALLARSRQGKSTAFVVDDAHTLDARTLAQILSLVANRTLSGEHLLQVVLVGLPELHAKLSSPACRPSLPTDLVKSKLHALPPGEVAPFIEHQLETAGDSRRSFTPEAMRRIAAYSKGIPREINALCGLASVIASLESSLVVTEEMVEEVKGERSLWGVGVDAQATPSTADSTKTQTGPESMMPWTSVHPTVYPPEQKLSAVNDSDAGDREGVPDPDLPQRSAARENVTLFGAAPPSPMTTIGTEGKPERHPIAAQRVQRPSYWLTGSALAFSVLALASVVVWHQFPFSGDSVPSVATGHENTRSVQEDAEAEIEFAQMRPVMSGQTPEIVPPTELDQAVPALSPVAPEPSAEAGGPASDTISEPAPATTPPSADQLAPPKPVMPTLASPEPAASTNTATTAPGIKTEPPPASAKAKEEDDNRSGQASSQSTVALSKPETATAPEQAVGKATTLAVEAAADEPPIPEVQTTAAPTPADPSRTPIPAPVAAIDPGVTTTTARPATPQSPEQAFDNGVDTNTVIPKSAKPPSPSTPTGASAATEGEGVLEASAARRTDPSESVAKLDGRSEKPATSPPVAAPDAKLPAILGAVDGKVYETVGNRSLDQITGEILPDAAAGGNGVTQFRRYLREAPSANVESAISASGALGASSAPSAPPSSVGAVGARLF